MKKLMILTLLTSVLMPTLAQARSPQMKKYNHCKEATAWVGQNIKEVMPKVKETNQPYRVAYEDGVLTDDYILNRLTIIIQDDGTILDVSCR